MSGVRGLAAASCPLRLWWQWQSDPLWGVRQPPSLRDSVSPRMALPWLMSDLWASGCSVGIAAWVVGKDVLVLVGATRAGFGPPYPTRWGGTYGCGLTLM